MGFVPGRHFRKQKNYFIDFFPTVNEFIDFLKYRVLDDRPITKNSSILYKDIDNQFIANFYYAFEWKYRSQIVLEQERFYTDLTRKMFDKRYQFGLLYQLWLELNDVDPFDNMNDNFYETYRHSRTEDVGETNSTIDNRNGNIIGVDNTVGIVDSESNNKTMTNAVSNDTTNTTDLNKANSGAIQGKLALSDMDLGSDEAANNVLNAVTDASVEKTKSLSDSVSDTKTDNINDSSTSSNTNRETTTKSMNVDKSDQKRNLHSDVSTLDEHKRNKINKVELINNFTMEDVQSGITRFVSYFGELFSSMNGGSFVYDRYWETDYDDLDIPEVPEETIPLSEVIKVTNIGYIPADRINSRTISNSTMALNPDLEKQDFFVSNIFINQGKANLIGDLQYDGMVTVKFVTNPDFMKN